MAKKVPGSIAKPWAPGDPLRLDKAIRRDAPDPLEDTKLDRADEVLRSPINSANHSAKPIHHKSFNRQKKG